MTSRRNDFLNKNLADAIQSSGHVVPPISVTLTYALMIQIQPYVWMALHNYLVGRLPN